MLKAVFIFLALVVIGYLAAAFFNPDLNRQVSALLPSFIVERAKNIFGFSENAGDKGKTKDSAKPFSFFGAENKSNGEKDGKKEPFYAPIYLPIKEKAESLPKAAADAKDFISRNIQSLPGTISEGISAAKEKTKEKIIEKTIERLVEGLDKKNKESLQKVICAPAL